MAIDPISATYVSSSSFTVTADRTSLVLSGRKIQADCGVDGLKTGTVSVSNYSGETDLTTVTLKESTLTTNLVSILVGIVKTSLPDHVHTISEISDYNPVTMARKLSL